MDDKTRITILKVVLGASAVTIGWNLYIIKKQSDTIVRMAQKMQENQNEVGRYIGKIVEVTHITKEQMGRINTAFDFETLTKDLNLDS